MDPVRISGEELRRFSQAILRSFSVDEVQARSVAHILVWCDEMGRANQGVWRLPLLSRRFASGLFNTPCHPILEKKGPAIALLDADNGAGHYIGELAMTQAIELASETGVGCVAVRNSNFFGAGAYYVQQAAEHGLIGFVASNSFPKVAAYNGVHPVLGTNPLAFGVPRKSGKSLLLDMATSASAGSTITKCVEQGGRLAPGIAIDKEGNPISDPQRIDEGALLPFGGAKGFGLALLVEIFCGVLTGAGISHQVNSMYKDFEHGGQNGHFCLAMDIGRFMPRELFFERMEMLVDFVKASAEGFADRTILLPGERRWEAYAETTRNGIELDAKTVDMLSRLAQERNIPLPWA